MADKRSRPKTNFHLGFIYLLLPVLPTYPPRPSRLNPTLFTCPTFKRPLKNSEAVDRQTVPAVTQQQDRDPGWMYEATGVGK